MPIPWLSWAVTGSVGWFDRRIIRAHLCVIGVIVSETNGFSKVSSVARRSVL
jgi:hypothetical protein